MKINRILFALFLSLAVGFSMPAAVLADGPEDNETSDSENPSQPDTGDGDNSDSDEKTW